MIPFTWESQLISNIRKAHVRVLWEKLPDLNSLFAKFCNCDLFMYVRRKREGRREIQRERKRERERGRGGGRERGEI